MSGDGVAFAAAAESLVGTRFRLHGRDPARGLDCVGVLTHSLGAIGRVVPLLPRYNLRNVDVRGWERVFAECGLAPAYTSAEVGDVVLVRPGPAQFHLLVRAFNGNFVHAHAALGRVTISPAPLVWGIAARWRLNAD